MKKIEILFTLMIAPLSVWASGGEVPLMQVDLAHDAGTRKQGAEVVLTVCTGCHNLKYIKYRDLQAVGFSQQEIDDLRGAAEMTAPIMSLSPPDMLKDTYGVVPPDLSLIAKARAGKGRYVYTLFNNFYMRADGNVDNHLFPGIRMPDVLGVAAMGEGPDKKAFQESMKKVASFLEWASDPNAEERESLGFYVLIYLIIFTLMLGVMKRRIWADVH